MERVEGRFQSDIKWRWREANFFFSGHREMDAVKPVMLAHADNWNHIASLIVYVTHISPIYIACCALGH